MSAMGKEKLTFSFSIGEPNHCLSIGKGKDNIELAHGGKPKF